MKHTTTILAATAFLLAATLPAFAQNTGFEIKGIEVSTPTTPKYDTDYQKRSEYRKWLEIEVEYEADPEFTEELTFRYYVFFRDYKGPETVFSGEVTHMSIPEGRGQFSVMYMSPQSLERILDGKSVTSNSATYIGVQILKQGQLVAESSTSGSPRGQWWTTAQNLPGYLLNKDETPFAPLVWDRYAPIKPTSR